MVVRPLQRCAMVACSIWDILSDCHTGPSGGGGGGWIVRNRGMSYDVAAIEGHRTTSWRLLVMFKNMVAMPEIAEYRTIVVRRRSTSLDVMRCRGCLYHTLTCSHLHVLLMMLCHGCATSYDIVCDRTTIVRLQSFSDDDQLIGNHSEVVRLSYVGRTMSYYKYCHMIINVPAIVQTSSKTHIFRCDLK